MATFSAPAAKEHVKGLRAQIVHRADQEFPFLHDTMIVPLGGRLLMAWYNCSENEIVGRTIIRGRCRRITAKRGRSRRSSARMFALNTIWCR